MDKQKIEDRVVSECWKLLTDETISKTAKAVVAACERDYDSSTLKLLRRDLKTAENAIENLWKALEQGQEVEGLRERIERRTTEKKDLEAQIAVEKTARPFSRRSRSPFSCNDSKTTVSATR